jgi:Carbohydrate family 9 binding domain-like
LARLNRPRVKIVSHMVKSYVCCRVPGNSPITIDGDINKPSWNLAAWTDDFEDILGGSAPKPWHRTRVKMLWDDTYLYIAALLEETHVWATLTERDSVIFHDNDFEIFLDPDGDCHQYYELEINALNTLWDLLLIKPYRNGGPAVNGWDLKGIKTAVHINGTLNDPTDEDTSWSVELALPWAGLAECAHRKSPPAPQDEWRINFSRVEWHTSITDGKYAKLPGKPEENWVWSPQGVVDMHRPEKWGRLVFTADAADGKIRTAPPSQDEPVRNLLMDVYHAQAAYRSAHGTYTTNPAELKIARAAAKDHNLEIHTMPGAFVATARTLAGKLWQVREDSHLTSL